jgi:hypothetical protein
MSAPILKLSYGDFEGGLARERPGGYAGVGGVRKVGSRWR